MGATVARAANGIDCPATAPVPGVWLFESYINHLNLETIIRTITFNLIPEIKSNNENVFEKETIEHTAEDADTLVVASASPFCFGSWCDERLFWSVLSSESRGDRDAAADGEPGTCLCSWLSCVCTWAACFCSSAAAATASLCFFNSDWWWRSCARISRSNWRASRASRSLYVFENFEKKKKNEKLSQNKRGKKQNDKSNSAHNSCTFEIQIESSLKKKKTATSYIPSDAELQVLRA